MDALEIRRNQELAQCCLCCHLLSCPWQWHGSETWFKMGTRTEPWISPLCKSLWLGQVPSNKLSVFVFKKSQFLYSFILISLFETLSLDFPGSVQGQVGQGFEQLNLVEDVFVHGREVGLNDI